MHEEFNIFHRDIKPQNLLLDADFNLKLADFGLATDLGLSDRPAGTDRYMAPEAFMEDGELSDSDCGYESGGVDIYSAGVTLFLLAVGRLPYVTAKSSDSGFQKYKENRESFWGDIDVSEDLKDLLN